MLANKKKKKEDMRLKDDMGNLRKLITSTLLEYEHPFMRSLLIMD